jgi:hypothetical protein
MCCTADNREVVVARLMMRSKVSAFVLVVLFIAPNARAQVYEPGEEGTFSIIGRDPATGQLGMAVHSKTIAVGSRTRGGKGGLAVFAHQSASNPMYSALGIELLEAGLSPQQALDMMLRADEGRNSRQMAILDAQGRTAAWTSPAITDWKGHKCGVNYCAQGNTLTRREVARSPRATNRRPATTRGSRLRTFTCAWATERCDGRARSSSGIEPGQPETAAAEQGVRVRVQGPGVHEDCRF